MGRPSNKAQRRREIVEATIRVMASVGFDGASVHAIAEDAGLSPGLLHHHFSGKQDILFAVLEHLESFLDARFAQRAARRRGPSGRLKAWVESHLAVGDDGSLDAAKVWVWLGAQALKDAELRTRYAAVVRRRFERLEGLVGTFEGPRSPDEIRRLATSTMAMVEGYYTLAVSTDLVESGSAAAEVTRWLDRQLRPSP